MVSREESTDGTDVLKGTFRDELIQRRVGDNIKVATQHLMGGFMGGGDFVNGRAQTNVLEQLDVAPSWIVQKMGGCQHKWRCRWRHLAVA